MHEELERATGPDGEELVLRRQDSGFVVESGGRIVLSSAARRSEEELARFSVTLLRDRADVTALVGGLGMGHLLRALLDQPCVARVDVVERCAPLIEWNRTHLSTLHREPPLSDPRVHVHQAEFGDYLRALRSGAAAGPPPENGGHFLAILLDLDNGPSALSRAGNAALYSDEGLGELEEVLRPGGVLALWSSQREPELMQRFRGRFQNVAEIIVPVDLPDHSLDYLYRCRRPALQHGVAEPAPDLGGSHGSSNGHSRRS